MQKTDDDLSKRLNSITFSTSEDSLSKRLESAHIVPKPAAIMFGGNKTSRTTHTAASPTTSMHHHQRQQRDDSAWDPLVLESTNGSDDDEGWGNLPSTNTAAAGDSLFGFSSILQTNYYATPSNSVKPDSAFAKFRNAPVSFTSTPSSPKP